MSTIQSADNQPDDPFGYSCYALVIPAPADLSAQVDAMRLAAGITRASIPAHVTTKGTFYGIASLDDVQAQVAQIADATAPFTLSFQGAEKHWSGNWGGLRVPVTPPLQALHDALVAAIAPLGTPAYMDDPYQPHMTIVYAVIPASQPHARQLLERADFGPGYPATAVDLMGRIGPAIGGHWSLIQRFPLNGGSPS